jgi:hypothetical protein
MRTLLAAALALLVPTLAAAAGTDAPYIDRCADIPASDLISAQTMESSRSFSYNRTNAQGFDTLTLWVQLTDADTSITRFDVTCTVSDDGNSTDYEPQECTSASGTYTCVDSGVWQKASPGTSKFPIRLDVSGFPDFECTFSVGAGAGAAADLLTVKGRLCTGG